MERAGNPKRCVLLPSPTLGRKQISVSGRAVARGHHSVPNSSRPSRFRRRGRRRKDHPAQNTYLADCAYVPGGSKTISKSCIGGMRLRGWIGRGFGMKSLARGSRGESESGKGLGRGIVLCGFCTVIYRLRERDCIFLW